MRTDAKVEKMDDTENAAKAALYEALVSANKPAIETILQEHPGLVNFEYKKDGIGLGTPLQIICSKYYPDYGDKDTGMITSSKSKVTF